MAQALPRRRYDGNTEGSNQLDVCDRVGTYKARVLRIAA